MSLLAALVFATAPATTPPSGESCDDMRGAIYEIRADAGPTEPADAPRRPYVVLAPGASTWVNAEGIAVAMTWSCLPEKLTLVVAGKSTVATRKDKNGRYAINETPLLRFIPKTENAARCDTLGGQRWRILGLDMPGSVAGKRSAKVTFQSDLETDSGPSIAFSEDRKTLDLSDGGRRWTGVEYTCSATGVRFQQQNRLELLTWSPKGLEWLDRAVRPPAP